MIQAVNAYNSGTQPLYRFRILQGIYLVDDPSLEIRAIQDRRISPAATSRRKTIRALCFTTMP